MYNPVITTEEIFFLDTNLQFCVLISEHFFAFGVLHGWMSLNPVSQLRVSRPSCVHLKQSDSLDRDCECVPNYNTSTTNHTESKKCPTMKCEIFSYEYQ